MKKPNKADIDFINKLSDEAEIDKKNTYITAFINGFRFACLTGSTDIKDVSSEDALSSYEKCKGVMGEYIKEEKKKSIYKIEKDGDKWSVYKNHPVGSLDWWHIIDFKTEKEAKEYVATGEEVKPEEGHNEQKV